MIFAIISFIIFSISALSQTIILKTFIKYKNIILSTPGLTINYHITIINATIIYIHE